MISVVIPFYKASNYILDSCLSASIHKVVSEIIVIYDGCPNTSFSELNENLSGVDKVILFHHDNYVNLGAGASRNLGIQKASNSWIAFLDADDYFLENKFDFFVNAISESKYFDGIYDPVQYLNHSKKIYGIKKRILPKDLFRYLIRGTYGHFHTNGLIVKKDLLIKSRLFNETLKLHQDSELWLRLAYYGILYSGSIFFAVAMVRVHDDNRVWKGTNNSSRLKQWKITWNWAKTESVGIVNMFLICRKIVIYKIGSLYEKGILSD